MHDDHPFVLPGPQASGLHLHLLDGYENGRTDRKDAERTRRVLGFQLIFFPSISHQFSGWVMNEQCHVKPPMATIAYIKGRCKHVAVHSACNAQQDLKPSALFAGTLVCVQILYMAGLET